MLEYPQTIIPDLGMVWQACNLDKDPTYNQRLQQILLTPRELT